MFRVLPGNAGFPTPVYRFGCELLLSPHETMVRSHMPSARAGRNPSRGRRRRKLVANMFGVLGSPVARLGAHGRRRAKRRGKRGPQSAQSAYSAPGPPSLQRESVRCRDAPVGAPPEGNAKEVTRRRRRVTSTRGVERRQMCARGARQLASRLVAAWSDSGVTVAERWPW